MRAASVDEVGIWVLAIVLSIGATAALLDLTTGEVTSNPESEQGYAAIERHFPPDPEAEFVNELILVRSDRLTVDDPAFRRKVEDVLGAVQASGAARNASSFLRERRCHARRPGPTRDADPRRSHGRL